jgi:hypothetical protein
VNGDPSHAAQWLVSTVAELAGKAVLPMPDVGIFGSPEWNAFATGPSPERALVAVSSGILEGMPPQELEAVLAHEMSHVGNGDMVTMTLLQGVINSFVMFLARAAALTLPRDQRDDGRNYGPPPTMLLIWPLEVLLGVLGSLVTAWFSRHREFRADAGAAQLTAPEAMALPSESRRLMLLRMFGLDRRSERLFDQLRQHWSPIGSIELIAGTDLALQQLSPADFLAFLGGRLRQRFLSAPPEQPTPSPHTSHPVDAAASNQARRRLADGSHPVRRQYLCFADTWQAVSRQSDVVVMDLRSFGPARQGCRAGSNWRPSPTTSMAMRWCSCGTPAPMGRSCTACWRAAFPRRTTAAATNTPCATSSGR